MSPLEREVEKLMREAILKGGKGNRIQQRGRMMAFARHAAALGARSMGQVGDSHVIRYWKASRGSLEDVTRYSHWLALRELWRMAGKLKEPPKPWTTKQFKDAGGMGASPHGDSVALAEHDALREEGSS